MTSTSQGGAADSRLRGPAIPVAAWSRPIGQPVDDAATAVDVEPPVIDDGPYQGLPLGGLGAGSIGRTFRGDFASWKLEIGRHRYGTVWPNQFSLYVEQEGRKHAQVLCTERPDEILEDWSWEYPVGAGSYHALFPRAWFVYEPEYLPVRLVQEQFSPVIPGNYLESSLPVAVFEWRAENFSDAPARVGLMLTWENPVGHPRYFTIQESDQAGARRNVIRDNREASGIEMGSGRAFTAQPWDGTVAIVAGRVPGVEISCRTQFAIDHSGADLWSDFAGDGKLDDRPDDDDGHGDIAGALAVTFELAAGEARIIPFALAWDFPVAAFPAGTRWHKRYTRVAGASGDNAWSMAAFALARYPEWREQIEGWQAPILADPERPEWYKTALFNELYYLVDGGTAWLEGPLDAPSPDGSGTSVGYFAYLECFDYPFYATHDVAFYSSWAILQLWPELERREMLLYAEAVEQEDLSLVRIQSTGNLVPRKLVGTLPHDLGAPFEDPFRRSNAYAWQDMNVWKDLNLKYVLRGWRDYVLLDDRAFLDEIWPTVPVALEYIRQFDVDGDGLLDHDGPDQTFDTWEMQGASAYTGGLLIAALEAAIEMARIEGDIKQESDYQDWLARARESFVTKLWNGRYFIYNTGDNAHRDSIMADQLAGQWYAGALDLPPVVDRDLIRRALQTVYDFNVAGFAVGKLGAVNGMRPDGTVDASDIQAREVWSGVTYALAALMIQEGLEEQGWHTAWGAYNAPWVEYGLWFRVPEAWTEDRRFRASMYMRPQAIWAIEHALERRRG